MIEVIAIIIVFLINAGGLIWIAHSHQNQIDDLDAEIAAMKRDHYEL